VELARHFGERQRMDMVFTVGQYTQVSMLLNSFGVQLDEARCWIQISGGFEMNGRLAGKYAIIVGAGQTSGETIGNGRAMAVLFARHGAQVLCVDRDLASASETAAMIAAEGGSAAAFQATSRATPIARHYRRCQIALGRIDILVNNVGIGAAATARPPRRRGGLRPYPHVNLKSAWMTIKHAVP